MKKDIHPTYFKQATVVCACGNTITVGSTVENIQIELCSKCHPFYTGKQKIVDSARRVEKFQARQSKKADKALTHKAKVEKKEIRAKKKAEKKSKSQEA
jgi:large subunit ribosomal protein L31